ncbi:MAG: DsbA family oxidoreductase [Nocardioidaceae bacterium]|nr:DsbA family oxidoreductase [Nocardioidaceae bacterium]NUS50433.1 DsbA family oxidoreductase [Nocardioidaceae bacterium]
MKVEIWSDVVCPWCYIGKRRFEAALAGFEHRDEIEVVWRSFELDPSSVSVHGPGEGQDHADRLAAKYGLSRADAEQAIARTTAAAAGEGLDFQMDKALHSNTFDAHRLVHLGARHGRQGEVKDRLMRAYFTEGEPVGDRDALLRIAVDAGLDEAEAARVLDGDDHADDVRADEAEARSLGITGVPFFVLDRRYGVSGAQPPEQLLAALEQAWAERTPLTVMSAPAAGTDEACGPDGCAI